MTTNQKLESFFETVYGWDDDSRILPYYASLVQNTQEKLNFWSHLILTSSSILEKIDFTLGELELRFQRKSGYTPVVLPQVLQHLARKGEIVSLRVYKLSDGSWMNWILSFVWPSVDFSNKDEVFLVVPLIKKKAQQILDEILNEKLYDTDRLFLLSYAKTKWPEIELLLNYMISHREVVKFNYNGQEAIKFASPGKKLKVTEADYGVLNLKMTNQMIKKQEKQITESISNLNTKAKQAVRSGDRSRALSFVKRKKALDGILQKKIKVRDNITNSLLIIQNAETDQQVLTAYKNCVTVIKSTNHADTLRQIDNVFDDLSKAVEDQKEIDDAINKNLDDTSLNISDEELEKEYQMLLSPPQKPDLENDVEKLLQGLSGLGTPIAAHKEPKQKSVVEEAS